MKNFLLFSVLLLLGILQVEAQQYNFEPGYVVTLTNDTLRGEIDFKTDAENNLKCRFRRDVQDAIVEYFPSDISLYRFINNGKYYVSHSVSIDGQQHTFFLEYLIQGMMNVYFFKYEKQTYYLFEKEDGTVIDLMTREDDKIEDRKVKEDLKYDGKLRYLFDGYIAPKYKTRKIDFDQKTMIDIAKSYHDKLCTTGEECIVFENKKPDARQIEFKVSAYTGIQFVSTKIWNTNVANFEAFPLIGGELAVTLPRITRLFSLVLDVSFSKFKIENRDRSVNIKLTEYSANVLSSRLGVRYSYPKYKLRPTIQVGAFYTNLMNAKCNLLQIDNHYTYRHDYPMPISYLGGYGEVGVEYKLRKNNFVFVRFLTQVNVFENYPGVLRPEGKYNWNMNQLKLGYTF